MANKYVYSGAGGAGTGADWANAYTTLTAAFTGSAAGDDLWVANDHAESTAGAVTLTSPGTISNPCRVICVNRAGSVPPVSADILATATIATTGANNLTIAGGHTYYEGIEFKSGSGAVAASILWGGTTSTRIKAKNCKSSIIATGASQIVLGGNSSANTGMLVEWDNCTVKFGSTSQFIQPNAGTFIWRNTASAIDVGGSIPTTLFSPSTLTRSLIAEIRGVDFSGKTSGTIVGALTGGGKLTMIDCQIHSGATLAAAQTTAGFDFHAFRVSSSALNYMDEHYNSQGAQTQSTTVKRTNGASDGTTGISWKLATTANSHFTTPFNPPRLMRWNTTTGAQITVTIEGVGDPRHFSALPKNDEFWLEVGYLGSGSNDLGSLKSGTKADVLATGSALTASTQAWDTGATARANTTAYNLGDVIKVATNSGRIFICTTAGTTAGSEPGGYATAVDGDAVVDNTATFKAAWRFKQTVTLTTPNPAQAGYVRAYAQMAKASSVIYLDPFLTLA